ncbi:TPA: hypothetical protein DHW58_02005 [Patescibacteria group bacterium]|uniref:Uncharacterized protein n=2 Tax=Bacteria division Kazan-3B-28 TaxID=1798534 RepID=A0A0G2A3N0_UNCK3|nr:MAG: hypothetical protein VE98_C0001G0221 [candidate division Kazan bacterium GW2011_GWA1_50_15]KKW25503.1 MAG: hypothetical protein VE99_C0001G0140 [candidate division Kazan bacterium GW2011_GWC1_52_13]KKW26809.1 MAG: hypothetical protein VF00_C0002G0134 [candidate division Kazan bacterium GW2011_GWB1_52_7]HCL47745.1 hypothetical protein [Patescibacteria group bacterium]
MNGAMMPPPPALAEVRAAYIEALVEDDIARAHRLAESANIDANTVTRWICAAIGLLVDEWRFRQALTLAIGCNLPMHVTRHIIVEWRKADVVPGTRDTAIVDVLCDHPALAYLFPDEEG